MIDTAMERIWGNIIEETASGVRDEDLTWMIPFWASFTDCVIVLDASHTIKSIRRKEESSFVLTDIAGKSFLDIAAEKDLELVTDNLEKLKIAAVPYLRFQFLSILGRYYRWTLVPYYENEVYAGCHGVAVDVTEQTIKEITLNWQRAVIEEGRDFVRIFDIEGNSLYMNPGAFKMTGYDPASEAPTSEQLYTPEHYKTVYGEGLKEVSEQGFWTGRGEIIKRDKTRIPVEHTMFSINNDQGEAFLIATILRDITVFLEHERKLEEARKAAEAANVAKSEFLSNMSHEIRTPMNAIIGMINIGMSTDDIDRKNYCFKRADAAAKHLLGLINDILDMSKIEADKLELAYSTFDFERALKNITNIANVRAEEKHLNFIVNIGGGVPEFIRCDEMRLSQVITNLLSNAIKFTPEKGTIMLNVENVEESGGEVVLRIEVVDTGIGISREQQEKLFSSFNQADASISQKYGGTGLGLAISKRIVELMGGEIWVESELGEGSTFIFTIKTERKKGQSRTKLYEKINLRNMRILAVDDSEETREYFENTMSALKLTCDLAADGQQALQMIEEAKDHPYDIYFVDWQMPNMDGIELTKKIREIVGDGSVVIMISANDWAAVEREAIEAGVNHFIPKPLFPSTLINSINICMGEEFSEIPDEEGSSQKAQYDFSGYTLLIAEDIEINREIMSAVLDESGIAIEFAENGKKAVSMFEAHPAKYDLILMDINMPVMDGYQATEEIRALDLPEAGIVPIIAMTANVFREDVERCIAAGMNDHIGKPIDALELFEKMSQYLVNRAGA